MYPGKPPNRTRDAQTAKKQTNEQDPPAEQDHAVQKPHYKKPISKTINQDNPTKKMANVPPPLNTANNQNGNNVAKVSLRQDSSVSSDSFSQTSSPSYTTKTMEAPLLPHHHSTKTSRLNGRLMAAPPAPPPADETGGNSPLTKSASTPASLQTIVRFHNGSNMSLHHKIIRDMRRSSNPYVTQGRLKFRFVQVLINAIALLAIGGGLAAYFRANPAQVVKVVNNTITMSTVMTVAPAAKNPAPGVCLPVIVNFCQYHRVPYNFTVFPNYIGHFGQRDAQQDLEIYDAVVDVRCYELAALFLCSIFVPKCGPLGHMVRPCRSLCLETMRRCGFFLDVFGLTMPDYLQCEIFPESPNTDVCLGHREVREAKFRAQKPVCPTGFQCDTKRCIPADWRCDGHVDCLDQSDELNCKSCGRGTIHCGERRCMAQSHVCDGKVDCPWGQDERNCLRLSESNGDVASGQLQLFRPQEQRWQPACVAHWDTSSPSAVCAMLGYSKANDSKLTANGIELTISSRQKDTMQLWRERMNREKKTNLLKEFRTCGASSSYVELTCTDFVCGKTRQVYAPSNRIVGGVEAAPGDWPFLAAILGGPEEVFYCAGVLIADQWVLTASHCVGNHSDVTGWTIQLGITRRHAHSYYGQKMKVKRVIPHPLYNLGVAHDNDVALFQLASKVTFHEQLVPVCLPPASRQLPEGTLCTVIGWGKREDKEISEYEPAVNEVQVPVLNRELCNSWLEHRDLNVTEGMICAGYPEGGKDACQGDSGGPLLCRDPDDRERWFVGGIVSWGIKCAHPRLPGVYAFVPRYVPWIEQQLEMHSD
ncbi:atrial natriuretic peptide-converting enzyme-like [Arctopsyche grandis]|uniref:atrial natriuretic peptide-converting enzyme-like n=1 Tax=Arctopsyche grandis TaxID=121162 RepID=UPI00406D9FBB